MRKAAKFLAFGVALMFGGLTARADMVITADKLDGTNQLAGWDIYHVFVTNNGVNGTGNNVVGWDIQIDNPIGVPAGTPAVNPQPFWFYRNNSLVPDPKGSTMAGLGVDIDGTGTTNTTNRGVGSFMGLTGFDTAPGGTGAFYDPSSGTYTLGTVSPTINNANYTSTKTWRVAAAYSMSAGNGNVNDRLLGTVRLGNVIVPKGAGFILSGTVLPVEGNGGTPAKFAVNASFGNTAIPEPASLGLVGLGMLALGRRRRQA